jgi:hypothetical protein
MAAKRSDKHYYHIDNFTKILKSLDNDFYAVKHRESGNFFKDKKVAEKALKEIRVILLTYAG